MSSATFTLLGSGAGPGAPSFFCDCVGCREAREHPAAIRTRSGALLTTGGQQVLIDTPPDLRQQLLREQVSSVDTLFITHWHYDHFGGIGELEYYVKLKRKRPITLYLPPSALALFHNAFPALEEIFAVHTWEFFRTYRLGEILITPLPARHSIETAGFMVSSPTARLAYFPDTAWLPPETLPLVQGCEYLICDATFSGENWFPDSHMSVAEAIELGQQAEAKTVILTHISVHYSQPLTTVELQQLLAGHPNVQAGYDGMMISL
jgi:phosphoribosyl 1,2-cyclic phosphate phosphodiesterase